MKGEGLFKNYDMIGYIMILSYIVSFPWNLFRLLKQLKLGNTQIQQIQHKLMEQIP